MTITQSDRYEIEAPAPGVTALERKFKSKANGHQVTQRLYTCESGMQLAAFRGGPLHMADDSTWEIATLCGGIRYGDSAGWVTDEQLDRAVVRLSTWGQEAS